MSHLNFKPETGLAAPETADIRKRVAADWVAAFAENGLPDLDTEASTPAGQLVDAEVAEIEAKNAAILYLANQFNPRIADGRWQDALGYLYFLTRKLDEPTVVTCQVTGMRGTTIPYGSLVQSGEGHTLICNHAVTIGSSGKAETTFRCSLPGPVAIAPRSVRTIVTTVPGWDSVDNEVAGAIGRDRETRVEFEARRHASVAANAHGSVSALYGTIADIDGVLDLEVLENIGPKPVVKYGVEVPAHGIAVCVYGGEDAAIAKAIYDKKDAGCDTGGNTAIAHTMAEYGNAEYKYRIVRPSPVNFWVRVSFGGNDPILPSVREGVINAIYEDFHGLSAISGNSRVGLASSAYASRFYMSVMAVEGVKNLHTIEVALGDRVANADYKDIVTINGDKEPILRRETISVRNGV